MLLTKKSIPKNFNKNFSINKGSISILIGHEILVVDLEKWIISQQDNNNVWYSCSKRATKSTFNPSRIKSPKSTKASGWPDTWMRKQTTYLIICKQGWCNNTLYSGNSSSMNFHDSPSGQSTSKHYWFISAKLFKFNNILDFDNN